MPQIRENNPLVRIPWCPELDVRLATVALAEWHEGVQAEGETRPLFESVLGPAPASRPWPLDVPFRLGGGRVQGISTCAMVAVGIARMLGVKSEKVREPYRPGDGLERFIGYARDAKAWQPSYPDSSLRPNPGDYVKLGSPMHALIAISWEQDSAGFPVLVSIDGGQVGAGGLQAIKRCRRRLSFRNGLPYLESHAVIGWIVSDLLHYENDMTVPQSFAAKPVAKF